MCDSKCSKCGFIDRNNQPARCRRCRSRKLQYGKQPDSKPMTFDLNVAEQHKYEMWHALLPKTNLNGLIEFTFTQTGIGTVITVKRKDKDKTHKIDITDYSNW
jgi:hypothetical protein